MKITTGEATTLTGKRPANSLYLDAAVFSATVETMTG